MCLSVSSVIFYAGVNVRLAFDATDTYAVRLHPLEIVLAFDHVLAADMRVQHGYPRTSRANG